MSQTNCSRCKESFNDNDYPEHQCRDLALEERLDDLNERLSALEASPMQVKIKRLRPGVALPKKAHPTDSGYDVASANDEPIWIGPGQHKVIPLGFALELPTGFEAQIRPRSGLASKGIICATGTVDANYRGELKAIIYNHRRPYGALGALGATEEGLDLDLRIDPGMRIAQLVIQRLPDTELVEVETLEETDRSDRGFGSSGV